MFPGHHSHPGSQGHSPSLFTLQCLALQAQIAAFTEQKEHMQRLEKTKSQAPAGRAAADPSEKVRAFKEAVNLAQQGSECAHQVFRENTCVCDADSISPALLIQHLSGRKTDSLESTTLVASPERLFLRSCGRHGKCPEVIERGWRVVLHPEPSIH